MRRPGAWSGDRGHASLFLGDVVGRVGPRGGDRELPGLRRDLRSISWWSTARTPPAASASPRRSASSSIGAGVDVVTHRQSCLGPARGVGVHRPPSPICCARTIFPPARRAAAPGSSRRATAAASWSSMSWAVFMDGARRSLRGASTTSWSCPLARPRDAIVVDFHAEATAEKMALGHYVDGRV